MMKWFKRGFTALLVLSFLVINLPRVAFCGDSTLFAKADPKTITRHEPKIMAAPAKDIPMVQRGEKEPKSKKGYVWLGLGAVVLLGLVAAGGGGGGGSNHHNGEDTGSITVGW